jgi:electron-transferring-flavoprotein dehydrogenase
VRWLGKEAEALGVDVFPASPVAEVLYSEPGARGAVVGVATGDAGVGKDGARKASFARGMEIYGRQTLFAEGARGSCSEKVMARFGLRAKADPQTYGLGLKEVWRIPKGAARPGLVQHTLGWPLTSDICASGGGAPRAKRARVTPPPPSPPPQTAAPFSTTWRPTSFLRALSSASTTRTHT